MPSPQYGSSWLKQSEHVELTVPSGEKCLVRRPNPMQLVEIGLLNETDTLSSLVDKKHIKRVKGHPSAQGNNTELNMESFRKDPDAILRILDLADQVIAHVVVEPRVVEARRPILDGNGKPLKDSKGRVKKEVIPSAERVREDEHGNPIVYTDQIDMMDRLYIFQYSVGGSDDLDSFRQQLEESD